MAELPRVVIINPLRDDIQAETEVLSGVGRVEGVPAKNDDEVASKAGDAEAILLWHNMTLTAKGIAGLKKCRIIIRMGVGVDNVDVEAATAYIALHWDT